MDPNNQQHPNDNSPDWVTQMFGPNWLFLKFILVGLFLMLIVMNMSMATQMILPSRKN